ncbi:MAG: ATP-binding cassette domain-containing protein [Deltaproteobacteria bacterium]|nr:ATP-binding cassette domain-containing protein [Candidatus Anaeroferrophillus wilburensis]MBN2889701.1 ATP-binding cassette domain-containing protein [Deltaproteobacteria bacterium]
METKSGAVEPIVSVKDLHTSFGSQVVHQQLTFTITPGAIVALIGESGTGKSVLLKEMLGLLRPAAGSIALFGADIWHCDQETLAAIRNRYGVLFQNGALFSALTVGDNVAVPLLEQSGLSRELIMPMVDLRLSMAGLSSTVSHQMPSDLSGGMRKRVALARALALEPELLFLDEPTSGLDPINARAFDQLVRTLSDNLGLTIIMVTHDLDTLRSIADRIIVLGRGTILADGTLTDIKKHDDPWIKAYFASRAGIS